MSVDPDEGAAVTPQPDPVVEVRKNERGAWCVYLDGVMVSDHHTHEAAREAARLHPGARP